MQAGPNVMDFLSCLRVSKRAVILRNQIQFQTSQSVPEGSTFGLHEVEGEDVAVAQLGALRAHSSASTPRHVEQEEVVCSLSLGRRLSRSLMLKDESCCRPASSEGALTQRVVSDDSSDVWRNV